jgi:hypothetical protein
MGDNSENTINKSASKPKKITDISQLPKPVHDEAVAVAKACYERNNFQYAIDRTFMGGQIKPTKGPDPDGIKNTCAHDMIAAKLHDAGITIDRKKHFEVYNEIACEGYFKVHPRKKEQLQSNKTCPVR